MIDLETLMAAALNSAAGDHQADHQSPPTHAIIHGASS